MSATATPRILPFGDQPCTLALNDYLIDCSRVCEPQSDIREQWHDRGLVVLTGTGMRHLGELQRWAELIFDDFTAYEGGSAPRYKWSDKVFGLDDAPPTIDLCFHNEGCYLPEYPRCFVIGSVKAPAEGGFTLVADNNAATDRLLETSVGKALMEKGVRYVRRMQDKCATNVLGYKSWQETFYTNDPQEAEASVRAKGWDFEWLNDGTLRTSYTVDAYEYHEELSKPLFFAGLASHAAFFDQWSPYNVLADEERPLNMTLGDGQPFTNAQIATIYAAHNANSLALDWRRADLAMLDNLRWVHARPAYQLRDGEERVMGVTMGMMKPRQGPSPAMARW